MEPSPIDIEYPERALTDQRRAFLSRRRTAIGGSDVAAILGISPWKSPLEVYYDKTGEENVEDRDNEYMLWGNVLEHEIACEAARRLEVKVQRVNEPIIGAEPHHMANIDRRIVDPGADLLHLSWVPESIRDKQDAVRMGLECKAVNAFARSDWEQDGIPLIYQAQCQWYLHVTGWDLWVMAALFGGNHLGLWNVLPDAAAQAAIVERVNAFWHDHVLDGVPPEPGPGDPDAELVRKLYPVSDPGKEVLYEDHAKDVDHWRRVYLQTSGEIKSLEGDKQEAANHLKHIMGDGEVMFLPDGKKLTWKNNRPSRRLDVKALQKELPEVYDEYSEEVPGARVLRVPKPKKSK